MSYKDVREWIAQVEQMGELKNIRRRRLESGNRRSVGARVQA